MASAVEAAAPQTGLDKPAARILRAELGDQLLRVDDWRGDLVVTVSRKAWVQAATLLKNHPQLDFKLFLDLCGVDFLEEREERFEVVLLAYSVSQKHHVRLKVPIPESD